MRQKSSLTVQAMRRFCGHGNPNTRCSIPSSTQYRAPYTRNTPPPTPEARAPSGGCCCGHAHGEVLLEVWRRAQDRIALEEVHRLEVEAGGHGRHDRVIFLARDVVESQRVPQHDVPVLDGPVPAHHNLSWSLHSETKSTHNSPLHQYCSIVPYLSDQTASVSSPLLWYTNSPPAHSSLSLYGVTHI